MIVPALTIYALPRDTIERAALFIEGTLYSGSSMIKNDFLNLYAVIHFTKSAPKNTKTRPAKYISGDTHEDSGKNRLAKSAITGILAPQGINGVRMAVALRSLSSRIVRQAITPGTEQPVPITSGITDFPERPTFLKIGSRTTETRAMYPQSSKSASKKYITITSGKKPTTAPTPPIIPSTMIVCNIGAAFDINPETHSPNISINVTSPGISLPAITTPSAIIGPNATCEIQNTAHITTANNGIPTHLLVIISSNLSCLLKSFVRTLRTSTSETMPFTKENRFLSASSTAFLSSKLITP